MSQKIKEFLQDHGASVSAGDELSVQDLTNLVHVLHLEYGVMPHETLYGLAYPGLLPQDIQDLLFEDGLVGGGDDMEDEGDVDDGETEDPEEPEEPTDPEGGDGDGGEAGDGGEE